jgi:uncharacterized protein
MSPSQLNTGLDILGPAECLHLMSSETIGRLGVVVAGRPEIYPVNFVLAGDDIMIRTDEGTKLSASVGGPVVFEVDHLDRDARAGWSVVVHGSAHLTSGREGRPRQQNAVLRPWRQAVLPHTLRIVPETITGRRISRTGPPSTPSGSDTGDGHAGPGVSAVGGP